MLLMPSMAPHHETRPYGPHLRLDPSQQLLNTYPLNKKQYSPLPYFHKYVHVFVGHFHNFQFITSFWKHKDNIICRCCICTSQTFPAALELFPSTCVYLHFLEVLNRGLLDILIRIPEYTLPNTTNTCKRKCFYFPHPLMKVCFSPQRRRHSSLSNKENMLPFRHPTCR